MPTGRSASALCFLFTGIAAVAGMGRPAHADVSMYYGETWRTTWLAQAGVSATTIDFDGLPIGSQVTDQYSPQGVFFDLAGIAGYQPGYGSDGWVQWNHHGYPAFPVQQNDGLRATFESPMHAIAMDHNTASAGFALTLYHGDDVIWSGIFGGPMVDGYEWPWTFAGIVSDQAFDRVWMTSLPYEPSFPGGPNFVILDTLMFSTVPVPGAAPIFALGVAVRPRSRRR